LLGRNDCRDACVESSLDPKSAHPGSDKAEEAEKFPNEEPLTTIPLASPNGCPNGEALPLYRVPSAVLDRLLNVSPEKNIFA
jgi:hypothetical protein